MNTPRVFAFASLTPTPTSPQACAYCGVSQALPWWGWIGAAALVVAAVWFWRKRGS